MEQGEGTYWSGVNSCYMMPTKPEGEGFTFSSAGNRAPELCRQNMVRVVLKVVCSQHISRHGHMRTQSRRQKEAMQGDTLRACNHANKVLTRQGRPRGPARPTMGGLLKLSLHLRNYHLPRKGDP